MVRKKIEEAYNIALKLGMKGASKIEKDVYKRLLTEIAICAIDELRSDVTSLMSKRAQKYNI